MADNSKKTDADTRVYGILGRPVAHSLSPAMHNAAFRELGVNAIYVAFPVAALPQAVAGIRGLALGGVGVTIPFKEEIIPLLDALDPQAARIGAVNTVVNREGRLVGYNTDWLGAVAALKAKTGFRGEHFLILGAGGAARAIAFGIRQEGGRVSLADIDAPKAVALARDLGGEALPLGAVNLCPAAVLINATPVGMAPKVGEMAIDPDGLSRFRLVMDIVYRPRTTRLLKEARSRGCDTIEGLQMLIHQGAAQFELLTGLKAPMAAMADAAYEALAEIGEES